MKRPALFAHRACFRGAAILGASVLGASIISGCEETYVYRDEVVEAPIEAPVPPPVEPAAPVEAEPSAPPVDYSTLPPEMRPSEETVQPESETLFY